MFDHMPTTPCAHVDAYRETQRLANIDRRNRACMRDLIARNMLNRRAFVHANERRVPI